MKLRAPNPQEIFLLRTSIRRVRTQRMIWLRPNMIKFYSAWFCPYAQRAWITLEYHKIGYEYIESLSVKKDQTEGDHGYGKNPRLLELNPKGLVPTLEFPPETMKELNKDQKEKLEISTDDAGILTQSMDCIEVLNSLVHGNSKNLIPDPAFLSDAQKYNQNICSVFYVVLMKPTREEQKEAFDLFCNNVADFISNVHNGGYYKSSVPTIVDFTVIPWFLRFNIFRHYRPTFNFEECMGKDCLDKVDAYIERMKELPAVQKTLWKSEEDFLEVYRRYADGTAESQVGQAVRSGKNAHDV